MKGLSVSVEEKARRYDEALEKARQLCSYPTTQPFISDLQDLFPELRESEDERIRKYLKHIISKWSYDDLSAKGFKKENIFAWLEKQGEQKEIDYNEELNKCKANPLYFFDKYVKVKLKEQKPAWSKEDERIIKELINYHIQKAKAFGDGKGCVHDEWVAWLEKQREQKSAVIIPKFRIGDEIKTVNEGSLTITKIDNKGYWSEDLFICDFDDADKWELVEQKPADNVERKGMNIVEEDMTPFQKEVFYIIDTNIEAEVGLKQECDELLRLAHDEIMQNTVWSEDDEKFFKTALWHISYSISNGKSTDIHCDTTDWFKSLKERVQPKQEWGEDDESKRKFIEDELSGLIADEQEIESPLTKRANDLYSALYWLESLRPQSQWKLNEEQIKKELNKAANEWDCKASFSPIAMVMDGDRPIGTEQHIISHADSFKAGVDWLIKKLRE